MRNSSLCYNWNAFVVDLVSNSSFFAFLWFWKKNSFQEGWWRWLFLCWCNSLVFISDDMLIQLGGVSRILFGRSQRLVSESFELRTRDKHLGFQIEELWAQNQRHVFYQTEGHFPRVGWLDFRDRMVGECWKWQTRIQDACFPCTSVLLEIGWQHSSKLKRIAVALSQESDSRSIKTIPESSVRC